jgi:predicted nucleotidyltransferase
VCGQRLKLVALALDLRREKPEEWYTAVFRLLEKRTSAVPEKLTFIETFLRHEADQDESVRSALEGALVADRSPQVRAACAKALRRAAATHGPTVDLLLKRSQQDKAAEVRGACALALRDVAPRRTDVRGRLEALLDSDAEVVRAGAVHGLAGVARNDRHLVASFLNRALRADEASRVRVACLCVLEQSLEEDEEVRSCLIQCLEDSIDPRVRRIAAQIVGEALAEGVWAWDQSLVTTIEAILMAVPTPCPHVLAALQSVVDACERHGGMRLESILKDALAPFDDRMVLAFVFGSVARREQGHDSDIDLMIVGDVRLKELVGALHDAEQALGREVNPALYTPKTFAEKYQAGDPFLLEVVRNDKVFLKGGKDELADLVAERLSPDAPGDGR